jgi:hypothetical protein
MFQPVRRQARQPRRNLVVRAALRFREKGNTRMNSLIYLVGAVVVVVAVLSFFGLA